MTMRITENRIYQDPVLAARNLAKYRFSSYEEYRDARENASRAIRQLQSYFERVSDPAGDMPGMICRCFRQCRTGSPFMPTTGAA